MIGCTLNCPAYGVAFAGFSDASCKRFRALCGDYFSGPGVKDGCPLKTLGTSLAQMCLPEGAPRAEDIARLAASPHWEFDYGLRKNYKNPIDCQW